MYSFGAAEDTEAVVDALRGNEPEGLDEEALAQVSAAYEAVEALVAGFSEVQRVQVTVQGHAPSGEGDYPLRSINIAVSEYTGMLDDETGGDA